MKELKGPPIRHSNLLAELCRFINAETIVEIGVQHAKTTRELARAAKVTGGMVYGYDYFAPIVGYSGDYEKSAGDEEVVTQALRGYEDYVKITRVDTHSDEFPKILKEDLKTKSIDFAFIDADHSYNGSRKDFETIYPLLSEDGVIAFHDTFTHSGLRKLVIDLYEDLNDGTFDIINLPFGHANQRDGITLLSKRSYFDKGEGISTTHHDPELSKEEVYKIENSWYQSKLNERKNK